MQGGSVTVLDAAGLGVRVVVEDSYLTAVENAFSVQDTATRNLQIVVRRSVIFASSSALCLTAPVLTNCMIIVTDSSIHVHSAGAARALAFATSVYTSLSNVAIMVFRSTITANSTTSMAVAVGVGAVADVQTFHVRAVNLTLRASSSVLVATAMGGSATSLGVALLNTRYVALEIVNWTSCSTNSTLTATTVASCSSVAGISIYSKASMVDVQITIWTILGEGNTMLARSVSYSSSCMGRVPRALEAHIPLKEVATTPHKKILSLLASTNVWHYFPYFDSCKNIAQLHIRMNFFVELSCSLVMACIAGWRPTSGTCLGVAMAMLGLSLALFLYLVMIRPYHQVRDFAFSTIFSSLQVVQALVSLFAVLELSGARRVLAVIAVVQYALLVVQLCWEGAIQYTRHHRRLFLKSVHQVQSNRDGQSNSDDSFGIALLDRFPTVVQPTNPL